jgi:hypothetical protein
MDCIGLHRACNTTVQCNPFAKGSSFFGLIFDACAYWWVRPAGGGFHVSRMPGRRHASAFLEGRLSGPESDELESHLDHCTACLSVARTVPAGGWLGASDGPTPNWIPAEELPIVDELLRRAASVRRGGDSKAQIDDAVASAPPLRTTRSAQRAGADRPYRLLSVLGVGGMGALRAEDERLRARSRGNLLRPTPPDGRRARPLPARGPGSGGRGSRPRCPGIRGRRGGRLPYLVMLLLPGESLASWIGEGAADGSGGELGTSGGGGTGGAHAAG